MGVFLFCLPCVHVLSAGTDVLCGPVLAAREHGLQGLAEGLVITCASILLNPASGVLSLGSMAARGLEEDLRRLPFPRKTVSGSFRQLLMDQILLLMRSEARPDASSPLEQACIRKPSAATVAAIVQSALNRESSIALPRLLCGQWKVLRRMETEDSLVQLVLMRLKELHRLPYSAHMLDTQPTHAAANLAAALAGRPVGASHCGVNEGDRNIILSASRRLGLVVLLLLGSTCVLLVGWPLGIVLVFDSALIGCVNVSETEQQRPRSCRTLVAVELSEAVHRQIHDRSKAAAESSRQITPEPNSDSGKRGNLLQVVKDVAFRGNHRRASTSFTKDGLGVRPHEFFNIVDLCPGIHSESMSSSRRPDTTQGQFASHVEANNQRSVPRLENDVYSWGGTDSLWQSLESRAAKWLLLEVLRT